MKINIVPSVFFVLISMCLAQQSRTGQYKEDFKILTQKNIFSQQRYVPAERPRTPVLPESGSARVVTYVLIGISSIDGNWKAFFEDMVSGDCQILKAGDEFEGGVIEKIDKAGVSYKRGEDAFDLVLGSDLRGRTEVSAVVKEKDTVVSEGDLVSDDNVTGTENSDSALQRLMERRKREIR